MFFLQVNKKIIFLFIVLIGFLRGFAQVNLQPDSISYDSLFSLTKYYAYYGEHQKAINNCRMLLAKDYNSDVDVLLGRIYSWTDNYDSSKIVLNKVISSNPGHYDALEALVDLEYWNDKYESALTFCDVALTYHTDDADFLLKKAKIYKTQKDTNEAVTILKKILAKDSANQDAIKLLFAIKDTTSKEFRFKKAQNYAFNKERKKARTILQQLLHESYDNEIAMFLGRIYSWEDMNDSAKIIFNIVLDSSKGNYNALEALTDMEYWNERYDSSIKYCDTALTYHVNDTNFLLKKARAYRAKLNYDEARKILNDILAQDSTNQGAQTMLRNIRIDQIKNKLMLDYVLDYYAKGHSPWHLVYLQYTRSTPYGSLVGRINYANRYTNSNGLQYEMDFWPTIAKKWYGYLNLGFSGASFFPIMRFGAEIYHNMPKAFEASLGFRYLDFDNSLFAFKSDVFIYTASLGKYFGNNWACFRTYITPSNIGTSASGFLLFRKYFADADNYIGLRFKYGVSPDDNANDFRANNNKYILVYSNAARIEWSKKIKDFWIMNIAFMYENDAIFKDTYTIDLSLARLF